LIVCPTVREADGLALSSRNAYLAENQRADALILYKALKAGADNLQEQEDASAGTVLRAALQTMKAGLQECQRRVSFEYLDLVHADTLRPFMVDEKAEGGILVGAIRLKGENDRTIRLIDNVIL
jgi:pantoate--beta-alanine ligase